MSAESTITRDQAGQRDPGATVAAMTGGRKPVLPVPDFTDSEDLRRWLNATRMRLRTLAMEMHVAEAEMRAALGEIPAPPGTIMSRSVRRRRARRVSRHAAHGAECVLDGAAAMVRTWAAFRREYAKELGGQKGRSRQQFQVVRETGR